MMKAITSKWISPKKLTLLGSTALATLLNSCIFGPKDISKEEKESLLLSALISSQINYPHPSPIRLNCNNNPYQYTNSQIYSNYDLYPVNCALPNNFSTVTPNSITGVGSVTVGMVGSQITATRGSSSGYLKLTFAPALATSAHNKVLTFTLTGNDSDYTQQYAGAHSYITIEIFGDPTLSPIYTRDIYQPSSRFVSDTGDSQYLNPRIVIPILYGPDVQEVRLTFSGSGQKGIADNLGLGDY